MSTTLILVRHAKAARPPDVADHLRQLDPRGERDAFRAGQWLRAQRHLETGFLEIVSSDATRATQTLTCMGESFSDPSTPVQILRDGTSWSAYALLRALRASVNPATQVLLMVGHNPALSELSHTLDPLGSPVSGLPTAGIAVHHYPGPLTELAKGQAPLIDWFQPGKDTNGNAHSAEQQSGPITGGSPANPTGLNLSGAVG